MVTVRLRAGLAASMMALVMCGLTGCVASKCGGLCGSGCGMQSCGAPSYATPSHGTTGCGTPGCTSCGHGGVRQASHVEASSGGEGCTSCGHGKLRGGLFLGKRRHGYEGAVVTELPGGPKGPCPDEINRVSLPPYKVAPPDILTIDLVRMVPRPPYRVEALETLAITVTDTLPNQPIVGPFIIGPDGTVNLGFSYGSVVVAGKTIAEVQDAIRMHLTKVLRAPQVTVALAQFRGFQSVRGEHLVRPDGTVSLGAYGAVHVAGLSLGQAQCVIEKHLSEYFLNPQISIDVFSYNSRSIYVIIDGGHLGQQVIPIPSTGNETVLDAISKVQGLAPVSSKRRIWVARPSPAELGCNQILPVNWRAITEAGSTATNYQLFPGDRVFVAANPVIAADNWLSIVLAPVERILGIMFLASEAFDGESNSNN